MNERQRRFAEHYAATACASEAARLAGYSKKTAYSQGERLLRNVEVASLIRQLQDQAAAARIATLTQVKAFWSDVLNDPEAKTADKLRASELLAKSAGAFLRTRPDDGGSEERIVYGEIDDDDVIIYLPDNGRDHDLQTYETTGGPDDDD